MGGEVEEEEKRDKVPTGTKCLTLC